MAKLRSVTGPYPLPRSEEEFLGGAPIALPENRNATAPDENRNTTAPEVEGTNDGLVAVTIRIPRRLRDALGTRAKADQRSVSQIAWRLLAPLLE